MGQTRSVQRTADFEGMLRGVGLRVTRPRVAVLSAVHDHPHADTDSIIGVVREDLGEVSRQGVYHVLRALTAAGLVRRFQPTGSVVRYEARCPDCPAATSAARPAADRRHAALDTSRATQPRIQSNQRQEQPAIRRK